MGRPSHGSRIRQGIFCQCWKRLSRQPRGEIAFHEKIGPLKKVKLRGLAKVDWLFVFSCAASQPDAGSETAGAERADPTFGRQAGIGARSETKTTELTRSVRFLENVLHVACESFARAEWKEFRFLDGNFRVVFPESPQRLRGRDGTCTSSVPLP